MDTKSVRVSAIAEALGAPFSGSDQVVNGIATLSDATAGTFAFVADPVKYADSFLAATARGAVLLVPIGTGVSTVGEGALLEVENPRGAFAIAVAKFFVPVIEAGISSTASVHPTAQVSPSAYIGDFTVLGPGVVVGDSAEIRHHAVLAANVRVGEGALIKSHAVIGEEGFGVDKDPDGNNVRLPHLGSVVIGSHVEVGNFTTVCSGTISPTRVGDYTKIDDHVHISHNVQIGRNVIITACAEISGSVKIGDDVWIGPNASIIQGVVIGARSLVGIGAVVTRSIRENEVQFGNPAKRIRDNHRPKE
ncbi:LpxD N-terminal domain-containing protein [Salinibacterium sp. PAMC 21357]|uniref:LpxD N-terminal domain-containing protein n=1 Tax=Salinibacterium sp. PAMC 21357 TaxID=1112215 RepID=UPI000287AEB4|nr:LpxD N-terminal domain-containing protein [Salinibacterium sp. PAMC 21357]